MKKVIYIIVLFSAITLFGCNSKTTQQNQNSKIEPTTLDEVHKGEIDKGEVDKDEVDGEEETQNTEDTSDTNQVDTNVAKDEPVVYEAVTGDNLTVAVQFTEDLVNENFDKVLQAYQFDDNMKKAMNTEDSKKTIIFSNAEFGKFQKIEDAYSLSLGAYQSVMVPVQCSNENYNLQLGFDGNHNIVGFTYVEYAQKTKSIEKTMPKNIVETEYSFTSDGFTLPGTLTTPMEGTNHPVVIFVHGSGASDRNESLYENTPFQDIAWALAEKGIASFRYDKRSYLYAQQMLENKDFTIYDETINDVVAAEKMVKEIENIDVSQVYILGHSLGGYLIPRIAKRAAETAGFIIMAGPAEHMRDYILGQYQFLSMEDDLVSNEEQEIINNISDEILLLNNPNEIPKNKLILGAYKNYWIDLERYNLLESAKKIQVPVLVLQGERDYQVTMKQFNIWKENFAASDNWTFLSYASLNHFMMPGEGKPSSAEYLIKSSVDNQVIQDIINFIN